MDPHFGFALGQVFNSAVFSFSGIYNIFFTVGFSSSSTLYRLVVALECVALTSIIFGILQQTNTFGRIGFDSILKFLGILSLLWFIHGLVVLFSISRGSKMSVVYLQTFLSSVLSGNWSQLCLNSDTSTFVYGNLSNSGSSILSIVLYPSSVLGSVLLTDIIHQYLGLGILLIYLGSIYSALSQALSHRSRLFQSFPLFSLHYTNSSSFSLISLNLGFLGTVTSIVACNLYLYNPFLFLSLDLTVVLAIYTHHYYIASILTLGSLVHFGIFLIRDFSITSATKNGVFYHLLAHKFALISHLSWVCLFLGFHFLGLYVHNDAVVGFGESNSQILIEPVFLQCIADLFNISSQECLFLVWGPGDFLVCHSISLGLHTTCLILIKGALDSRGSSLMPDKLMYGYGFACDGPGRGGTCDISAWDSFYLATFWALNTIAWIIFYFHWKNLGLWQDILSQFFESSTYLNAWFRDFLWFNSASLINGYSSFGVDELSVWALTFLGAHLVWATGFMFLISWRKYWQELVDIMELILI